MPLPTGLTLWRPSLVEQHLYGLNENCRDPVATSCCVAHVGCLHRPHVEGFSVGDGGGGSASANLKFV